MRLKLYSAPTMAKAMELMHSEMGEDAVVLSAFEEEGRAEVRAAAERRAPLAPVAVADGAAAGANEVRAVTGDAAPDTDAPLEAGADASRRIASVTGGAVRAHIQKVLDWHDVPPGCMETVANAGIRDKSTARDPQSALAAGLRTILDCAPLELQPGCPILLFGPPGAGRTTVAARLVRHFGSGTVLVNADFRKTGNIARLRACSGRRFVANARSPERLLSMVERYNDSARNVIIDGPSINQLDPNQMRWFGQIIEALAVEPVLVMSAEGRGEEMEESARAFAGLGAGQVIISKLDLVRRLGAWISAISMARLSLAHMSLSPLVNRELVAAHHGRLARLLLETAPMADFHLQSPDVHMLKGAA